MPQPGEILFYREYEFEDGSTGSKLFVVLNAQDVSSPCLVLKTTSQSKRYQGVVQGCNQRRNVFFAPSSWQSCFDRDTYIQLPQILEISTTDLLNGSFCNNISVVSSLSSQCFLLLKQCLKQFRDDISGHHFRIIFP